MKSIQKQALDGYGTWLDYEYHLHVTTRLAMPRRTEQELYRTFTHEVLSPLASYLKVRVAAISVLTLNYTSRHAHSLLFSPDRILTEDDLNLFMKYKRADEDHHSIFDHDKAIVARQHNTDRKSYVYDHLISQDGALHFHNKNLLTGC
jgi:hypothetical protein